MRLEAETALEAKFEAEAALLLLLDVEDEEEDAELAFVRFKSSLSLMTEKGRRATRPSLKRKAKCDGPTSIWRTSKPFKALNDAKLRNWPPFSAEFADDDDEDVEGAF